jgi:hypothetical protein
MKKVIFVTLVLMALLMMVSVGFAVTPIIEVPNESSGNKTSDATIFTGSAIVKQVFIQSDGTTCSVALYGNTSAVGDVIFPAITCVGANGGCTTEMNVLAKDGIYADMTLVGGSECTYNIHYIRY